MEQAIRLDRSRPDFYSEELGNAYEHMGRYQEAISLDKRYLTAHPNSLVHTLGWFSVTSRLVATRTPELRQPRSCGSAPISPCRHRKRDGQGPSLERTLG